ncbi:hypothetical protein AVEN_1877-1 [Araneus ventricosus]|uniref:Uncharacterized protein n=1 Tax=Araneus ventricosus TaxID=182803 RepID=A0A4Y2HGJ7_ARAVE|nr:hypothetical protein AVEN_1877-1 [Araneus ventricosus]
MWPRKSLSPIQQGESELLYKHLVNAHLSISERNLNHTSERKRRKKGRELSLSPAWRHLLSGSALFFFIPLIIPAAETSSGSLLIAIAEHESHITSHRFRVGVANRPLGPEERKNKKEGRAWNRVRNGAPCLVLFGVSDSSNLIGGITLFLDSVAIGIYPRVLFRCMSRLREKLNAGLLWNNLLLGICIRSITLYTDAQRQRRWIGVACVT